MARCVTWKQPDANHFSGFCTNRFRLTTPPELVTVNGGCELCVIPLNANTGDCGCPPPKEYRGIHYLKVTPRNELQEFDCEFEAALGEFLLFGTCSGESRERQVRRNWPIGVGCDDISSSGPRWKFVSSGPVYTTGGQVKKLVTIHYYYLLHTSTVQPVGPWFGLLPWCSDEHGSSGILSTTLLLGGPFNVTISTDAFT